MPSKKKTWPPAIIRSPAVRPLRELGHLPEDGWTTVAVLCREAGIPFRVTGGHPPRVAAVPGAAHIRTFDEEGRETLLVGGEGLPPANPERAVRMLEILAHAFHDYAARESVRGLFKAPRLLDAQQEIIIDFSEQ